MKIKEIDILSIDAKDIYISNNYINPNPVGYNIRLSSGELNLKKFINSLDGSIDVIKLREVYEKVYRNTSFTFFQNHHEYTTYIINVTFKYSNKEYNKIKTSYSKDSAVYTYVKFGYDVNRLTLTDGVCVENNVLLAIEVDKDIKQPVSNSLLGKYFYFEDGVYKAKPNIKTLNSVSELRDDLYENGFYCDGKKYVRFKRSTGSARVGKCLFIDEKLYLQMFKWSLCGLKVKEGQEIDLASFEASISLTLSSIIDTIEISPENILVIDDYDSVFKDDVIETVINPKTNLLETKPNTVEIRNSIWDGQSLLDKSLFGKYEKYGMVLLRNRYFKSCCFNTNVQQWFKDNNITDVSQLNGFTLATKIEDVKLITTPNSIKYLKFGSLQQWIDNLDSLFGVVKHEKPTSNFDGRMVQTHYQLLNTLQISESEMREFLKPSLDYLYLLKTDPDVVRYHIKYPDNTDFKITPLTSKNDIIYKLLGLNNKFSQTKLYQNFKNSLTKSYVKNLRCGHVLVNGNYSTILGNPIEMLQHSIGRFDGTSQLGVGNIHNTNFEYNKTLLGSRSPHVTIGNVWLTENVDNREINTYCNLTNEIVCINSIGESLLDRLSGCDMDSDTVLLTDNEILIKAAQKNYLNFKVPVNHVESIKKSRTYTKSQQSNLDFNTSDNKIGDIINLAQELNSLLWDKLNNGGAYDDVKDLYYDICQLDVMSGIEIDKAKKEFMVDTFVEIKKIKKKYLTCSPDGKTNRPKFFDYLDKAKPKSKRFRSLNKNYIHHDTSMDYLEKIVNSFQAKRINQNSGFKCLNFSDIINKDDYNIKNVYYNQVRRVIEIINQSNDKIKYIYSTNNEFAHKLANECRQECVEYIGKLKFNKSTMIYLILLLESEEHRDMFQNIINILFGYPNTEFFEILQQSKEPITKLVENKDGDIRIHDMCFSKKMC